jgi:MFS family permease
MATIIVCRALMGIFEASFGAGAPYFLSLFYRRSELGFRISVLLGMSPLANCFASSLAFGIVHIKSHIESWRLLFIIGKPTYSVLFDTFSQRRSTNACIEGAPTVLFAVVVYCFLTDGPNRSRFLNEADRTYATERLETVDRTKKGSVSWKQYLDGLGDYQNYVHAMIHFCCNYSFAVSLHEPFIKDLDSSTGQINHPSIVLRLSILGAF